MNRTLLIFLAVITSGYTFSQQLNPRYLSYIETYSRLAVIEQERHQIPASITLAQALLESAAGQSELSKKGNNHFGIKCGGSWTGGTTFHDDDKKGECFRKYSAVLDSYEDHSQFLKRQRYAFLFDYKPTDYKSWAYGLRQAGYATDPNYPTKLIKLIEDYELHRFDQATTASLSGETAKREPSDQGGQPDAENNNDYIQIENNGVPCVRVKGDEQLKEVAKRNNRPASLLRYFNDMQSSTTLAAGDYIYLAPKKGRAAAGNYSHIISGGESMHSVSQQYGIKLKKLYKLNDMTYGTPAKVGMTLKLR